MNRRLLAMLAVVAFLPVVPLLVLGYGGHDYAFHLGSWIDLRQSWQAGRLRPGWAALANFTLGDPRFCFYPPVSLYVGAALTFLLPLRMVPGATVWLAMFLGGVTMFAASRDFVSDRDRPTAAVMYMLNPYLLTTALVRFAAAELWVQAWLPLVLLFFQRAVSVADKGGARRATMLCGCLLGLTWLTNIPASIVLAYLFSAVTLWLTVRRRSIAPLAATAAAQSIGVGLAAFHSFPAFVEKGWISTATLLQKDFHLWFMTPPLKMPHKILGLSYILFSWISIGLIVAYALRSPELRRKEGAGLALLVTVALVAFVFELPVSVPLWDHLPMLAFVQFPCRFLAPIVVALPLVLLGLPSQSSLRAPTYAVSAALALLPLAANVHAHAGGQGPGAFADTWANMQGGYAGVPEYRPSGAAEDPAQLPQGDAPRASGTDIATGQPCRVDVRRWAPTERVVETEGASPCRLRLRTFYYPYWHAKTLDGAVVRPDRDASGWLVADVPAGRHTVTMEFRAESAIRSAASVVTFLTALLIAGMLSWATVTREVRAFLRRLSVGSAA